MKKIIYIVITSALILSLLYIVAYSGNSNREFSKKDWDAKPKLRYTMVDDLLQKYDFKTMTKDEVIDLLGKNKMNQYETTIGYLTWGGYLGDEELVFVFDKNGKITKVGIGN